MIYTSNNDLGFLSGMQSEHTTNTADSPLGWFMDIQSQRLGSFMKISLVNLFVIIKQMDIRYCYSMASKLKGREDKE